MNTNAEIEFGRPVRVVDDIWWIGTFDADTKLHCNPYLVKGESGIAVIDGGSRPDFAGVMMKILQAGVHPGEITALIYQHPDPDLCGSLPNFLDLCTNPELRIYSKAINNVFIRHYVEKSYHPKFVDIDGLPGLSLGKRRLTFIDTPFAHASGSFVTYDGQTGTLFTSDLFGSYRAQWDLFLELGEACFTCTDHTHCPNGKPAADCPLPDIINFHRQVMPSTRALKGAMTRIAKLAPTLIAPQHGSILRSPKTIAHLIQVLGSLEAVGIDGIPE
ncbi:MAG TPA: MBL fold metallo-hydrolase [Candidatus Ozemobacteraceae bacterium]|nr:MBL fold metallo-hydrolase [Candidatus Ozemobacteraceae bacterium]